MVSLIIAAPIFLFISKSVSSQDKWFKFGTAPQLYENFIDSSNPHQGRGAMTLKSFDTTINGFGTLAQMMRPGKYLDKRVRMTGYLKSKDAIGWAGFWFRVDQSGSQALLSFDNMEDRPIKGTTNWKQYEIVLDVPYAASNLVYGALISGTGQIWIDKVNFEVVDTSVRTTGQKNIEIPPDRFDTLLTTFQLDTLNGRIKTIYTKGYELRAKTMQSLVEKCSEFYEQKFPDLKFTVQLLLLNKSDWNKLEIGLPYGMPNSLTTRDKLMIAADKNAVGKLFGGADTLADNILSDFDYIALHELGHNFLMRQRKTDAKQNWANEFLASYFAICYIKESKIPAGLPQKDQTNFKPQHKTLKDFEDLYLQVGPENYAWYQGKFQELGYRLYPKYKIDLIRTFIENYSISGKHLDPIDLLRQLAPEITNQWLEEMK
jgi:hypothetical protein